MDYYIVIAAHNESQFIALTLQSIVDQKLRPKRLVVVDDHSTDNTATIIKSFQEQYDFIYLVQKKSEAIHLPGSKVIRAFQAGYDTLNDQYDFIVKADADLIFPENYFETIANHFSSDPKIGMAGGFAYIQKDDQWILENLTDKDHIRGAFKAYRQKCFEQIGGLKPAMGWDTVDELLCKFYDWKVVTDENLKVKHLKPTGANYNVLARYKQGEAFYRLGYGFWITAIASLKLALRKKKPFLFFDYIKGFLKAQFSKESKFVTLEQEKFIRNYRWKKIYSKLF